MAQQTETKFYFQGWPYFAEVKSSLKIFRMKLQGKFLVPTPGKDLVAAAVKALAECEK
jgi:hypothetical protein